MIKTSKIKKCQIQSKWLSPTLNKYVYYHELIFENGDFGVCGRMVENPEDMKVGCNMEYDINGTKIKFIRNADEPQQDRGGYSKRGGDRKNGYKKKPDEFLGYAYSYAKDLVVAGKTSKKNLQDLQTIATTIYAHITTLLMQEEIKAPIEQQTETSEEEKKE